MGKELVFKCAFIEDNSEYDYVSDFATINQCKMWEQDPKSFDLNCRSFSYEVVGDVIKAKAIMYFEDKMATLMERINTAKKEGRWVK